MLRASATRMLRAKQTATMAFAGKFCSGKIGSRFCLGGVVEKTDGVLFGLGYRSEKTCAANGFGGSNGFMGPTFHSLTPMNMFAGKFCSAARDGKIGATANDGGGFPAHESLVFAGKIGSPSRLLFSRLGSVEKTLAVFHNRNLSKGPSKPKGLDRKVVMGQFICRFCILTPNERYAFHGKDDLINHLRLDHAKEYNERDICNTCGNPWAKGEEVICYLLPQCPRQSNIPKREVKAQLRIKWLWRKKSKYNFKGEKQDEGEEDDFPLPPIPQWIKKKYEGNKVAWSTEVMQCATYINEDDTCPFLLNKIGMMEYFYMKKHGLLDEEASRCLEEIIDRTGIRAVLIKREWENDSEEDEV